MLKATSMPTSEYMRWPAPVLNVHTKGRCTRAGRGSPLPQYCPRTAGPAAHSSPWPPVPRPILAQTAQPTGLEQVRGGSGCIWHLPVQTMRASVCMTTGLLDTEPASLNPYFRAHLQRVQPAGLHCTPCPRRQMCCAQKRPAASRTYLRAMQGTDSSTTCHTCRLQPGHPSHLHLSDRDMVTHSLPCQLAPTRQLYKQQKAHKLTMPMKTSLRRGPAAAAAWLGVSAFQV